MIYLTTPTIHERTSLISRQGCVCEFTEHPQDNPLNGFFCPSIGLPSLKNSKHEDRLKYYISAQGIADFISETIPSIRIHSLGYFGTDDALNIAWYKIKLYE